MIKVYDSSLGKYVTVGSNRGDNLYTKSINFNSPELPNYDNDSSIITIDEALTSISEEIKEVKEGVAWVYKNGTLGGGGGTGSGIPKFKVTSSTGNINNDAIIVNNNQTLNLSFTITGSSTGRKMNITIKDDKGNYYNYNNSTYVVSSKSTNIQIPNIKEDLIIEFTGYDQETLSIIEPYTLHIRVSSLKISAPESVQISKSETEYNITYNVSTTYGQSTYVILSTEIDGNIYEYITEPFIDSRNITLNVFNIFIDAGLNLEELLKGENPIDNMEITAKAISGDYSNTIKTSIVFTSENKISVDIIPLSNVSGDSPSYVYTENDNISFTVKLYFNTNEYYMYYKLYQLIDNEEIIVFEKGDINDPKADANKISSTQFYSKTNPITIPYPSNINNTLPVYVYVKAWDKTDQTFNGDRKKWFGIRSDETWKPYNLSLSGLDTHIDGGLNYLYYEYNSTYFGETEINDKIISSRVYRGSGIKDVIVNGYIKYYNANNITNGVLLRNKSNENVNTFRMSSNSYGIFYDEYDNKFMPFGLNNNWMKNDEGWTLSISYKADNQSDSDAVIFSCASFDNLGNFSEGVYITTTDINVKFTNSTKQVNKWNLNAKISQNIYNQIDITYKPKTINLSNSSKNIGELKVYVNGVLAAAGIETNIDFEKNNYYPTILSDTTVGCSHNGNTYSNFADVNFYRILFYKRALTPYHITKNFIQGKADVEVLSDGNIDRIANNELRGKNFFTEDGKCLIIDDTTYRGECSYVKNLYSTLSTSESNPLPIVMIKVPEEFRSVVNGRYTEDQVAEDKGSSQPTITREYDAVITIMKEKSNKQFIMGSTGGDNKIGDNSGKDCTVKLQGTSTLGNKSKNFEISFGAAKQEDNTIKENLVQVFDDMLPENSWVLKADVMDSGHANNAAIGGFINDFLSSYSTIANTNTNNKYASEIKATTEGHPVILFMQFGDGANQEFLGIYSFNLGRISYYNLGYQVFDGYYKVISSKFDEEKEVIYKDHKVENTAIEFPALVSSYKTIPIPYTNNLTGVDQNSTTAVCYECNGNNNIVGTFQQSDTNVINEFYNRVYPSVDNANSAEAAKRFRKLFIATSNLYECDPEYLCKMEEGDEYLKTRSLLARNSKGEFRNKETSLYETFNKNSYDNNKYALQDSWAPTDSFLSLRTPQTNENDNHVGLNWEFASAYFTLASLFGLTDSLGKNLNIRSFNLSDWYISFYDMDTGLGLTNAGYETVKPDVYLDKFSLNSNQQEIDVKINGYREGGFDTINSRLFNIIRFFTNKNYTTTGTKPTTNYRKIWEDIRKTLLKDPNNFIDNYYIKQNKNVGEIIFNYDYDVKYINDEIDMITNPNTIIKSGSINFLHGNRINFVRDWFNTHVFFLDGVFDIKCKSPKTTESLELYGNAAGTQYYGIVTEGNHIESDQTFTESTPGVVCPYITFSNQSNRVNPPFDGYKPFTLKSNIPMFFIYNNGTLNQRLFIDKNKLTNVKLYFKSGNEQTMTFNNAPYLTIFDKFGTLSYVTMQPNLSSLTELDLSDNNILSGAQDSFDISRLVELKKLNMNNVKTTSGYPLSVNLQNAYKISYIDLRNANVNSLTLPGYGNAPGGSLEEIYIDKTTIQNIDLTGHAMLKKFSANECENLSSLTFKYNTLLEDVGNIPTSICGNNNPNLNGLIFDECNSLKRLSLSNMKYLSDDTFVLGHLENLEEFTYIYANISNGKQLTTLNFSGCPNLKKLNLPGFVGDHIILNNKSKNTLEELNIANSKISYIIWANTEDPKNIKYEIATMNNKTYSTLDLRECKLIKRINIQNNENINYVILPDKNQNTLATIEINVLNCNNLIRIIGDLGYITVNKFKNLKKFYFNELCKYNNEDVTSHIILNDDGDVQFEDEFNYKILYDIDENDESIELIKYESGKLLTHYNFIENDESIDSAFSNTSINISDLYAILRKLSKWKSKVYKNKILDENGNDLNPNGYITEFIKTFENCENIKCGQINYIINNVGEILDITPNPNNLENITIENKHIRFDIFSKYPYLKKLDSTFKNCKGIKGRISSSTDGENDNIFKYIENLSEIKYVFNGCDELWINSNIFNSNKELTLIEMPFSDLTSISKHIEYYPNIGDKLNYSTNSLDLEKIFKNLKKLVTVDSVFYNTNVFYDFSKIDYLFKTNIQLENIKYILPNNFTSGTINEYNSLSLSNIFGGCYRAQKDGVLNLSKYNIEEDLNNLDELYPRNLINLEYAFATNTNTNRPMLNWDNLDYIFYNLNVNEHYEVSLKNCKYMFNNLAYVKTSDADGYYNYSTSTDGELAKFPLNIFNIKCKTHDVYFSNLNNIEGLFMNCAFKDELLFPGNIFKYCTADKLNLSHLLENTIMTPIKLVTINDIDENGENYSCFSNCKLDNISAMFKNCFKCSEYKDVQKDKLEINNFDYKTSIHAKYDRGGLHGIIPYKFFYNVGNGITNMESVFEGCKHLGVNYNEEDGSFKSIEKNNLYYSRIPDISTLKIVKESKDYSKLLDLVEFDGINYIWNTWSYDGTTFNEEYLNELNSIKINNETYLEAKHNSISDYILVKYNGNNFINSTEEIINDKQKHLNDVTINDIIDDASNNMSKNMINSLLTPKCYIKHDDNFITLNNTNYIKIYVDTDYDVKNVNLIDYQDSANSDNAFNRLWNCGKKTFINNKNNGYDDAANSYQHEIMNTPDNTKTSKVFVNNYILPMDVFRYCSPSCNINYAFKNIGTFNETYKSEKYNNNIYGIIGRIPPRLFEKLSKNIDFIEVFNNYKKINPYSQSLTGQFNSNMFKYNAELNNITGMFSGAMILGHLHDDIFINNRELRNISNLFKNSYTDNLYGAFTTYENDYINFINNNIFRNNNLLSNLSSLFERNTSDEIPTGYLYFNISNDLFTPKNHPYISNVSSMFMNQNNIQRDSNLKDDWIKFNIGWSYMNNYINCYTSSNFNLNDIPKKMGGNKEEN